MSERRRETPDAGPDAASHLPLTPATFHLLLALADGPQHGYAAMKRIEAATGGEVRLGPGTLYGMTKRLLEEGLIAECDRPAFAESDGRGRRTFELTPLGRAVARAEAERLERTLAIARGTALGAPEPA